MKDMVSMEMTKDIKKRMAPGPVEAAEDQGPKYSWGSRITIEDDHVDAMGMGSATVDDEVEIVAHGKVIGSRSEDHAGGKKRKSVEIQITNMGIGKAKGMDMEKISKSLYGKEGK